jgi:putative acetyltransferase
MPGRRTDRPCLRAFAPGDLEPVARLWRAAFLGAHPFIACELPLERFESYLGGELASAHTLRVVAADDTVLGFLARKDRYVSHLYVAPDEQRRGVGSWLLAHARREAGDGLWLRVYARNVAARRFYERRGFHVTAVLPDDDPREHQLELRFRVAVEESRP